MDKSRLHLRFNTPGKVQVRVLIRWKNTSRLTVSFSKGFPSVKRQLSNTWFKFCSIVRNQNQKMHRALASTVAHLWSDINSCRAQRCVRKWRAVMRIPKCETWRFYTSRGERKWERLVKRKPNYSFWTRSEGFSPIIDFADEKAASDHNF